MEPTARRRTYDFLYLPRAGESNLSYAFINFITPEHAAAFKAGTALPREGVAGDLAHTSPLPRAGVSGSFRRTVWGSILMGRAWHHPQGLGVCPLWWRAAPLSLRSGLARRPHSRASAHVSALPKSSSLAPRAAALPLCPRFDGPAQAGWILGGAHGAHAGWSAHRVLYAEADKAPPRQVLLVEPIRNIGIICVGWQRVLWVSAPERDNAVYEGNPAAVCALAVRDYAILADIADSDARGARGPPLTARARDLERPLHHHSARARSKKLGLLPRLLRDHDVVALQEVRGIAELARERVEVHTTQAQATWCVAIVVRQSLAGDASVWW